MNNHSGLRPLATLGWTLVFLAAFVLPKLLSDRFGSAADQAGFGWAWLLIGYPIAVVVLSAVAGVLHRTWLLPIGVAVAWVAASLLVLNSTALVYALGYAACSALTLGLVALALRNRTHHGARAASGHASA